MGEAIKKTASQYVEQEESYFTERQIEVLIKRALRIVLSSTERDILQQAKTKIEKAKEIVKETQAHFSTKTDYGISEESEWEVKDLLKEKYESTRSCGHGVFIFDIKNNEKIIIENFSSSQESWINNYYYRKTSSGNWERTKIDLTDEQERELFEQAWIKHQEERGY